MKKAMAIVALLAFVVCACDRQNNAARGVSVRQDGAAVQYVPAERDGSAPQKFALVIGNGNYTETTKLNNPVNDANDVAAALQSLGFTVDKVLNGTMDQMINGIMQLKNRLSVANNSYGFLFYAGHGVQSNGENYLIPVDANIPSENFLRNRTVSVQEMLDELNEAGNVFNVVVLDACRDNPFSWKRSGSRGLSVVAQQPADSIIVFATSAGSTAADGTGRNGLFTSYLLNNLTTPGIEVTEMFRRTNADVARASNSEQRPAVYSQFYGIAYLGAPPAAPAHDTVSMPSQPELSASAETGNVTITSSIAGEIIIDGIPTGSKVKAGGTITISNVMTGSTSVAVKADDGKVTNTPQPVMVQKGQTVAAVIGAMAQPTPAVTSTPSQTSPTTTVQPAATPQRPVPDNMVRINGGTFTMGSPANEPDRADREGPQHQVTVSAFYMGKYEVTQKEYQSVMGTNPSNFKGDNIPVEMVTWYDAVEYCNRLSQREGLTPAYTINGTNVTWNRNANGYRLPTEAEWEYACRAGTTTAYNTGASISNDTGWYYSNSSNTTHPVGRKPANRWGLYDMHGNVWEWCWDWFGDYSSGSQTDPSGASSGSGRVSRGGSWLISAQGVRSASRFYGTPDGRYRNIGFRVVRP